MESFNINRYCYENADITAISRPSKYSLEFAIKACNSTDKITDALDRFCPIHGSECIGHMERYKGMLFLPIWMTPSSKTEENALVALKHQCIHGLDYRTRGYGGDVIGGAASACKRIINS
jgi:hypothetical protein